MQHVQFFFKQFQHKRKNVELKIGILGPFLHYNKIW